MSIVSEYMENHEKTITYLCTDIDYSLQAFEDHTVRLGKAYYNGGKYIEAIEVYETFFAVIRAIFKKECPPPYHDFDSGDCYLLLAQAYLAIDKKEKAMDAVENSIIYYLNLLAKHKEDNIDRSSMLKSPLVRKNENHSYICICKNVIKKKLLEKLSEKAIQPLCQERRFIQLLKSVKNISI